MGFGRAQSINVDVDQLLDYTITQVSENNANIMKSMSFRNKKVTSPLMR